MRKSRTVLALAVLASAMCSASRCNQDVVVVEGRDKEITLIREILLLNTEVINSVDDFAAEQYDGSDEAFAKLETTVCVLETWQYAVEAAWKATRIYEMAKVDYSRKLGKGEESDEDEEALAVYGSKVMSYLVEVARLAVYAYDIYRLWGKEPPKKVGQMIENLGMLIGGEQPEAGDLKCEGL